MMEKMCLRQMVEFDSTKKRGDTKAAEHKCVHAQPPATPSVVYL